MISTRVCPSCLSFLSPRGASTRSSTIAVQILPFLLQTRHASGKSIGGPSKKQLAAKAAAKKKRKAKSSFDTPNLKDMLQFSLVDAMRYLRAAEAGYPTTKSKYELHVRLKTPKNGAVVRNRLRLPHPVKTDVRICVICPPGSDIATQAKEAGASLVGDEQIFEAVKNGTIDFDRCICHADSVQALNKAGVAKILGPRGLMPSLKTGTVVKDVPATLKGMVGGAEYRERAGCVRLAIGQLGFTADQLAANMRTFLESIKKDMGSVSDRTPKEIHEVVLSSTIGPGMSLNGDFR